MKKIDLKRELKSLYLPSAKEVALVEVPTMNYLMIDRLRRADGSGPSRG